MDILFILTIFPHQCVSKFYHSKKHAVSIFLHIYSSGKWSTFNLVLHNSYLLWDYDMCARYTEMNKQTNHQGWTPTVWHKLFFKYKNIIVLFKIYILIMQTRIYRWEVEIDMVSME